MSTKTPSDYKSSDTTAMDSLADRFSQQLARSFTLGTDGDGYQHHYYRPADTVVVYNDTGVDHYRHLDGRPLTEWRAYVAETRGWTSMGPYAKAGIELDRERKEADN